jgi:thymidylate kinase
LRRRRKGGSGFTVALLGPDGSGKSTISQHLDEHWPVPVRRIYMGVSAESSNLMLPTTRLASRLRRRYSAGSGKPSAEPRPGRDNRSGPAAAVREWLRILNLIAEEWFRVSVAGYHTARGRLVIFDRHYLADYYFHHIEPPGGRPPSQAARFHGWQLKRFYPRPDLVLALDAPTADLLERKQEDAPEWLDRRRSEYARMAGVFDRFVTIDVARPLEDVLSDVLDRVGAFDSGRDRGDR